MQKRLKTGNLFTINIDRGAKMEQYIMKGGNPLKGEVTISGAKNAAVAILPAALLINGTCTINNLPNISDVKIYSSLFSLYFLNFKRSYQTYVRVFF